jgi:hypothetical protein
MKQTIAECLYRLSGQRSVVKKACRHLSVVAFTGLL